MIPGRAKACVGDGDATGDGNFEAAAAAVAVEVEDGVVVEPATVAKVASFEAVPEAAFGGGAGAGDVDLADGHGGVGDVEAQAVIAP